MTPKRGRLFFWGGFFLYAISFWLTAVRGHGVFTTDSPSIAGWTFDAFLTPLIYLHWNSGEHFLEDLNIAKMSFFLNGWINPLFLLTMVLMLVDRTPRLTRILRYTTLLMVPFCWVALLYQSVYPREGYVLWTLGMVLVLFPSDLDKQIKRESSVNRVFA